MSSKFVKYVLDIYKMLQVYGDWPMSRTRNFLGGLKVFRTEIKTIQTMETTTKEGN
jgi:hypothetical protein